VKSLGKKRAGYIGSEIAGKADTSELPQSVVRIVAAVGTADLRKGRVLQHYYSDMRQVISEMWRVLRPGKSAVVVVGNSIMRGIDTRTADCLAAIGQQIGFDVPPIGVRKLDRDRRMMPAGTSVDFNSQIQQRMHEEYVIGFHKPEGKK